MTREQLKRLIEPTQDGGTFQTDEQRLAGEVSRDYLTLYIESAIEGADVVADVSNGLQYAIDQLRRAQEAISGLDDELTDKEP